LPVAGLPVAGFCPLPSSADASACSAGNVCGNRRLDSVGAFLKPTPRFQSEWLEASQTIDKSPYRSFKGTKANAKRKVVISPDNAARRHKRREHRYHSICHKGRRCVPPDSSVFRLHLFA